MENLNEGAGEISGGGTHVDDKMLMQKKCTGSVCICQPVFFLYTLLDQMLMT
jgi:hypothetical protein